jgi:uncharacterized alkaline shock family protein YloU
MCSMLRNDRPEGGAATEVALTGHDAAGFHGTVRIAPAVLLQLVDLTMAGLDGFAGLRDHDPEPDPGARRFSNGKIAVTVDGDQISVSVGCAISRNTNVAEFSRSAQKAIGFAVGNMLNMTVKSVDLTIQDVAPGREAP